jgi:hypothetical protein
MQYINKNTPFPWTITRSFHLEDGTLIDDVEICAEDAEYATGGDWYINLGEPRFADLDEDQTDEAMDIASDLLSAVAEALEAGEDVALISPDLFR